ncbi:zinc-ribbon domain-containing protein [Agromyces humi]|uniref:zinc-ribbon domain-containing protein n=1 Tax=Agromyces humi TaxID=1766800 RepID=UPI0013592842|nr:zinc-ribbon domain-containing protein [Agromyces humi]
MKNTTLAPAKPTLPDVNSALAAEWHPTLNGTLDVASILPMSGRKVWWLCGRGHTWEAKVSRRSQGSGCPVCAGKQVLPGVNDLATRFPRVAAEWHHERNGTLTASEVFPMSKKTAWWQCGHDHEWEAAIADRTGGAGCPVCAGRRVVAGVNDLGTSHPEIAVQWNTERNRGLTPQMVTAGSGRYVHWICADGHTWEAVVISRTLGSGCPACAGYCAKPGVDDISTTHPGIAAQWHHQRNRLIQLETVKPTSKRNVWWKCREAGHEWKAPVVSRTRANPGCFMCEAGLD